MEMQNTKNIKLQFVPHRELGLLALWRPTGYCWSWQCCWM